MAASKETPDFEFVISTPSYDASAEKDVQKLVRKHAMRSLKHRKTSAWSGIDKHCRVGNSNSRGRDIETEVFERTLDTRRLDPPAFLLKSVPQYAFEFLHYFHTLLNPNLQENSEGSTLNHMRTVLVPAALSQHMYFETMMYMVSTHLDVLRGIENSRATLSHRGNALRLISEHLHQQQTIPNDLVIVTVFGLVNYDNVNGQLSESAMHMAGVQVMVTLRGGLGSLGMNGVLAKIIMLSDVMGTALRISQSNFRASDLGIGDIKQGSPGILPIRESMCKEITTLSNINNIPEKIVGLLTMVREINLYCPVTEVGKWTDIRRTAFLSASTLLQRELFSSADDISKQDLLDLKYHQYVCCSLAAHIYVASILSPLSFAATEIDKHVDALIHAMRKVNSLIDWAPIPEAFVWVCLVGAAATKNQADRRWMVAHLGPAMMCLGMHYFEDLMHSMLLFSQVSNRVWENDKKD